MRLHWPIPAADPHSPTLPAPWWIAVAYAQNYALGVHTGIDLNLNNYEDTGKPIYAIADGVVTFAGNGSGIGWPNARDVVVIRHPALKLWTRYAHLAEVSRYVQVGTNIREGETVGVIGDYGAVGPADDHLHFDIARIDLSARPGDWPGTSTNAATRVLAGYVDPLMLFRVANS